MDNKRLRILMVNCEFPPIGGGAANANLHLLREIGKTGIAEIDLLTAYGGKGEAAQQFAPGVKIYKIGIKKKSLHHWRKTEVIEWLFKAGKVYKRLINEKNYDLAHAFFAFPSGWFCWRHRKKLPYIVSLRGSDVPGYNENLGLDYMLLGKLFRLVWKDARCVVANSKGLANLAERFMPELNFDIIPNGVNMDDYSFTKTVSADGHLRLLSVGRLVARKRINVAIKALPILTNLGINAKLTVAGGGILKEELKILAQDLGVSDKVDFLGEVPKKKIPALYSQADIFIMCSRHEGMSNAMLEAMASGLPIITSNCEGVAELIRDNGIILEKTTPQNVAESVKKLVDNKTLLDNMGDKSRERASHFSWQNAAMAYIEKYRQFVD